MSNKPAPPPVPRTTFFNLLLCLFLGEAVLICHPCLFSFIVLLIDVTIPLMIWHRGRMPYKQYLKDYAAYHCHVEGKKLIALEKNSNTIKAELWHSESMYHSMNAMNASNISLYTQEIFNRIMIYLAIAGPSIGAIIAIITSGNNFLRSLF